MTWWQQPFFQVALPIIIAFAIATWYQSAVNVVTGLHFVPGLPLPEQLDSRADQIDPART